MSKRPFSSVKEMDETVINNWNSVVRYDDIVYHLGDFGDYNNSSRLNGKIHLLFGNYERKDIEEAEVTGISIKGLRKRFYTVDDRLNYSISFDDHIIALAHEPSNMIGTVFNLFGHIHKLQMVRRNGLNVGVDCHNFTPIDLETVLFYKNAIENHYDDEVFGK
ncbi:hypothetical protein [Cytobacillus gottheilii]|uniref:hypothetical protein n=1 Tax=Cytobacillus gottheilii TaxID=859144 RepID=UPI001C5A1ED9|nr:hypothetical protein [Cytobacillus gottheilii]